MSKVIYEGKLTKAAALKALYDSSKVQGMGALHGSSSDTMTIERAEELLEEQTYFDYLGGKVMKVDLSNNGEFDSYLYDRDNGEGAALKAVAKAWDNR